MKTVTKYLCETTNTEFATEKEALDSERFERRVQEEAQKRRRQPLTKADLLDRMGRTYTNAILKTVDHFLRVREIQYSNNRIYLVADFYTALASPPDNYRLYNDLGKLAAALTTPVYLLYSGFRYPVMEATENKQRSVLYIEIAYEETT